MEVKSRHATLAAAAVLGALGVVMLWNRRADPSPESRALDAPVEPVAKVVSQHPGAKVVGVREDSSDATATGVEIAPVPRADAELRSGPFDSDLETEEQFRRRVFRRLLAQFDGQQLDQPEWPGFDRQQLAPMLLLSSMTAHLDAAGRGVSEDENGTVGRAARAAGFEHVFEMDGICYAFRTGEFQAYDEYVALCKVDPAVQQPFGIEPEPPRELEYPEEFFRSASVFAHRALALGP